MKISELLQEQPEPRAKRVHGPKEETVQKFLEHKFYIPHSTRAVNGHFEIRPDGKVDVMNCGVAIRSYSKSKLPFRFGEVAGDFLYEFLYTTNLPGVPEKAVNITIENSESLENIKGLENTEVENVKLSRLYNLNSLEGLPKKINNLIIDFCTKVKKLEHIPESISGSFKLNESDITSLEGMPKYIGGIVYIDAYYLTSLIGISDQLKSVKDRRIIFNYIKNIKEGGLGLVLVEGLTRIDGDQGKSDGYAATEGPWKIIQKYLGRPDDIFECQAELIENGFEEYAKL